MPNGRTGGVRINVRGEDLLRLKLKRTARDVDNLTRVNRNIAFRMLRLVLLGFRKQAVPGTSDKWTKLSKRRISQLKAKGTTTVRILQDTGDLRKSFTIEGTNRRRAVVGTNIVYAGQHHFGFPKRNIPKRPMLPPDKVVEKLGLKILNSHVRSAVRRANR